MEFESLYLALGYQFRNPECLRTALTHRSFANESASGIEDNERLEFLGDTILGLAVSGLLFERFPEATEGELTRRRAELVCERSLANLAETLRLGEYLRFGRGEERSGGRLKPRLLASALEACLAAVYLDGGLQAAIDTARQLTELALVRPAPLHVDYKSQAQQRVQAQFLVTPRYTVVRVEGPEHQRSYVVALLINESVFSEGVGRTKTEAEHQAAKNALALLAQAQNP